MENLDAIIAENDRRNRELASASLYDPVSGLGCCGPRVKVPANSINDGEAMIPESMVADNEYDLLANRVDWVKLRCRHDFEYWAFTCVRIRHKITGKEVPFRLNAPQRRVLSLLETDRRAKRPIRMILLKARQWGGSTLVQMYMAWIQTCLRRKWHSLVCAHVKDTSASIRGMYTNMLAAYPAPYWMGDEPPRFRPFERSVNIREIAGRDCRVTIGSCENPEAIRGADIAMAHLSEVAFWSDSTHRNPESMVRAICGSVAMTPLSLVVMESTANGVGSYFHDEWLRSVAGKSDKRAVFVPWYEIEIYRAEVADPKALWKSLDDYERKLWTDGLTLEMIQWYHDKRREYSRHSMMQAEYPTNDVEAFVATGHNVFSQEKIEAMRADCRDGERGDLVAKDVTGWGAFDDLHFVADSNGGLEIWERPYRSSARNRYLVVVDVGGRTQASDFSVIAVFDRACQSVPGRLAVVAQWRGHIDKDLLVWKSAAIARFYDNALLVIESNSLDHDDVAPIEIIVDYYANLYQRIDYSRSTETLDTRYGFHTNRETKPKAIAALVAAIRDHAYIERSHLACNEFATYEQRPDGRYEAKKGHHDDILMTRAIGIFVNIGLQPVIFTPNDTLKNMKVYY